MPLSVRARVEIYLPDQSIPAYQDLLRAIVEEFTNTFGGCTVIRGLDGHYLSKFGQIIPDRVNLVYTDTSFDFQEHAEEIGMYTNKIRDNAFKALNEVAVLVVFWPVYHSE